MITDQQFTDWLSDTSAIRCILVEVSVRESGIETTRYLSSIDYYDSVAGRTYQPIVDGNSVQIVESLSITGTSSINFGDVEVDNSDGSLDSWLDDVWANRAIVAYVGDKRWDRADFRIIFSGVVDDIDSSEERKLNIKMLDKMQRLNTPVTDQKLGGATQNADKIIPLTFGEAFNISPLSTNPATLEYQVHDSAIEEIKEVRDEGVPVPITAAGNKFTLNASPFGKITCSVQGDKPTTWSTNIADICQRLATGYGEVNNRFAVSDIDTANFASFASANPQPVGVYVDSRISVFDLITRLSDSVGAKPVMSRTGELRLKKIELPAPGTALAINDVDIQEETFTISARPKVKGAVKLGHTKNYTTQGNLNTGIPADHKEIFSEEWRTVTQEDVTVKAIYKLDGEPEQKDTLLLRASDANTEATRLLNLWKAPRNVYSFTGTPRLIELELGDAVELTYPRFGLSATNGMIITMSVNWANLLVDLEVLT